MDDQLDLLTDYGRINALKNEFLVIPREVKKKSGDLESLISFTTKVIPNLIREFQPFYIRNIKSKLLSPYEFKTFKFTKGPSIKAYRSINDLLTELDLKTVSKLFKRPNVDLIGIDESRVETPFYGSAYAYLKSVAFRISKTEKGQDEIVGPLVTDFEVNFGNMDLFEKKNQFLGYLRNLLVTHEAISQSLKEEKNPIVFLHGPLVRAIGGFTDILLDKEESIKLLTISLEQDDDEKIIVNGETLLREFHESEVKYYDIIYESLIKKIKEELNNYDHSPEFERLKKSLPFIINKNEEFKGVNFEDRKKFPGLNLYLWLLNRLFLICAENKVPLTSVVENIEMSTEFVRYVLPSVFIENISNIPSAIKTLIGYPPKKPKIESPESRQFRAKFYRYISKMIDGLNVGDSVVTTYLLNESEYTAPIQTFRYLTKEFFQENLNNSKHGISNKYESIINYYFNPKDKRVLFSYIRTTPLREPIRVEFFDIYGEDYHNLLGATYILSLLYPNYGLPIILYYVDLVARTHQNYPKMILDNMILDILLNGNFSIEDILVVTKTLSRNYWDR